MTISSSIHKHANPVFSEDDYLSYNIQNGVIRNPSGVRILTIPSDLIRGLHAALDEETGQAAPVVMKTCGKFWGQRIARNFEAEVRQAYEVSPTDLRLGFFLQVLRRYWALYGWGDLQVSFDLQAQGFLELLLDNMLYTENVGSAKANYDALFSGVLSAIFSQFVGQELDCDVFAGKSNGEKRTRFLVGLTSRVAVVSEWLRQGRHYSEVVESIKKGDLV